jgi:uroporphyrinogen-III synthase
VSDVPTPAADPAGGTGPAVLRVLVTRPQPQADEWVARLAALGVDARAFPLLGIAPPADPRPVADAWTALPTQALAMFVSPTAVERFFAAAPAGSGWPPGVIAAGTGPGTESALRRVGVPDDCVMCPPPESPKFDTEALWPLLQRARDWRGARATIVRGEGGREWLADVLRKQGAQVAFVEAYRRVAPQPDEAACCLLADALAQPERHAWLFSSSEAAGHLPALAPGADWTRARALATHPRIAQAVADLGFGSVDTVPPSPQAVADWVTRSIQSARS